MGFRFRRSFKIAPGFRINLGKNGASVSVGRRGAHYTVSTSGRRTTTVGIPGTGLSYSTSTSGKKNGKRSADSGKNTARIADTAAQYKARPAPSAPWYRSYAGLWILGAIGIAIGLIGASSAGWMLLFTVAGIACIAAGFHGRCIAKRTPVEDDVWTNLPALPIEELQAALCPGGDWKKLVQSAQVGLPQWARIATESMDLMRSTTSPDTYFSRYQLVRDMVHKISAASCVLKISNCPPGNIAEQLEDEHETMLLDFIERSYQSMAEKAAELKTENGRRNRHIKYYESLLPYTDFIAGRAAEKIVSLMEADGVREEDLSK